MKTKDIRPLDGIEDEEAALIMQSGLPLDEQVFVTSYLRHRSLARAARDARLTRARDRHDQRDTGLRYLAKPIIRDLVDAMIANRLRRLQVTPVIIEQELAKVAFASVGSFLKVQPDGTAYLDFTHADAEQLAGLKGFKCKVVEQPGDDGEAPRQVLYMEVTMGDKLGALDKLGRLHRMIAGSDPAVIVAVDIEEAIRAARERAGLKQGEVE